MRGEAGNLQVIAIADFLHEQRVLFHREGMEVVHLAEQLPAGVDHRLDVSIAEFGGDLCATFERFVRAAAELHVKGDFEFGHGGVVFGEVLSSGAACGDGFKRPLGEREIGERKVDAVALGSGHVGGKVELRGMAHVGKAEHADRAAFDP